VAQLKADLQPVLVPALVGASRRGQPPEVRGARQLLEVTLLEVTLLEVTLLEVTLLVVT
jgi:hypothetical protein